MVNDDNIEEMVEGARVEASDHSLALYDQEDVRTRMLSAMDEILKFGFGADLLTRPLRGGVEYRLKIATDGAHERPVRTLQAIADKHRLSLHVSDFDNQVELVLYPRA